jgi:hypothetical protein
MICQPVVTDYFIIGSWKNPVYTNPCGRGRYELYKPDLITEPLLPVFTGGGSYEPESRPIWTNAEDTLNPVLPNKYGKAISRDTATYTGNHVTLWRWREDFQNDFAARMDWTFMTYEEANLPPIAVVNQPENFTVRSGGFLSLMPMDLIILMVII